MTHVSDVFNQDELDAIEAAQESHHKRKQTQQDFLDAVSGESDTELLNTKTELAPGHTVTLEAKLNGEIIDTLGGVQERLEHAEESERMYEIPDAVDDASQLLADIIVESAYDKDVFYQVYQSEGPQEVAKMLQRSFESLEKERERLSGDAEGFRNRT